MGYDFFCRYHYLPGTSIYHREDGPAIERSDGTKIWFFNGVMHRENGPAGEYPDGYKTWYIKGKRHRLDGPAVVWNCSHPNEWWVDGVRLSPEKEMVLNKWWNNKNGI